MKNITFLVIGLMAAFGFGFYMHTAPEHQHEATTSELNTHTPLQTKNSMKLGAFSISLSVKDLNTSKQFYENFGFKVFAGSMEQKYLIMKSENALIGLFQGMFEGNILTFNPGWDENAKNIETFNDVREIQKELKSKGVNLISEADEKTSGPASLMLKDPDGNMILVDQHR